MQRRIDHFVGRGGFVLKPERSPFVKTEFKAEGIILIIEIDLG
jgi:hypothetical protein